MLLFQHLHKCARYAIHPTRYGQFHPKTANMLDTLGHIQCQAGALSAFKIVSCFDLFLGHLVVYLGFCFTGRFEDACKTFEDSVAITERCLPEQVDLECA